MNANFISLTYSLTVKYNGCNKDSAQKMIHEASHVIAYMVNLCKIPNIIVTVIDTFSVGN